ncbi:MAG: dockerin type I repeat-containing protein [Ruminococcus sp.]|uniref:dockerin type I repeat-containing protein n=1 Tax=Ruminococcus sp. TaxID=41978 RepID=UPI0025F10740|nr:dockerin type I repeat-containing protein [Ruminococcus sp.]MCR4796309.1 dockerin type I repeat-containing protein [Ruminococcus sp.]
MKKTLRTVLTAAAFAAAGASAMTAVAEGSEQNQNRGFGFSNVTERDAFANSYGAYGPPPTDWIIDGTIDGQWGWGTTTSIPLETLTTTTMTMPRTVYGPTSTSTVTTSEQEDIVELTTTMLPQPAYGPAPVLLGDANMDGVVDIFDAVALRKAILFDEYADKINRYFSDLNKDGEISVGDLVRLNRYLLGTITDLDKMPERDDEVKVTTTTTTTKDKYHITETAFYDPRTDIVVPVYGPPSVFIEKTYETSSILDSNINTTNGEK